MVDVTAESEGDTCARFTSWGGAPAEVHETRTSEVASATTAILLDSASRTYAVSVPAGNAPGPEPTTDPLARNAYVIVRAQITLAAAPALGEGLTCRCLASDPRMPPEPAAKSLGHLVPPGTQCPPVRAGRSTFWPRTCSADVGALQRRPIRGEAR